jgi:hypothetical protein
MSFKVRDSLERACIYSYPEFAKGETPQKNNEPHLKSKGAQIMSEVNSVVAICDSHSQAEEAVKELQRAGFDMTKVSIVGDVKTGKVMLVCDRPWAFAFIGSSYQRPQGRDTTVPDAA